MITNPFLLQMIGRVLPEVVNKHKFRKQDVEQIKIMRTTIYDKFTYNWFQKNNGRLMDRGIDTVEIDEYEGFAKHLASRMLAKNIVVVEYIPIRNKNDSRKYQLGDNSSLSGNNNVNLNSDEYIPKKIGRFAKRDEKGKPDEWELFFDLDDQELSYIRQGIPIRRLGENTWAFIHKSLLEYFGSRYIFESAVNDKIPTINKNSTKKDQQRKPQVREQKETSSLDISSRLLNEEPGIIKFLAEIVDQNPKFENKLWEYIEASKGNPSFSIPAANAMTILNVADKSFSGMDLRNLKVSTYIDNRWQGPNIAGGIFGGTDLSGSDLRGSIMFGSFFGKANLSKCNLTGSELWIAKKTFKGHSSDVYSVSFSNDEKFIASGSSDNTVKIWEVS